MLDAQFNWWGTNDTNTIVEKIYDFIDDGSLGVTNYGNFLNAPNPDAPPAPPTNPAVSVNDGAFTLTWDPNPESDIEGYRVYYDIDSSYPWEGSGADQGDAGIDVGNVTEFDLTGLPLDTYYFTVRAYDNGGAEGWFAREVSASPVGSGPTPTPTSPGTGTPTPTATPTSTPTNTPTPTPTDSPVACPADLNSSGRVNTADLSILVSMWGDCDGCAADLDQSGQVNMDDLNILVSNWGDCP